jgi:hypothetical protein
MPITAAQTTAFFEQTAQMGIPNATVVRLRAEGIETVADLADCDTVGRNMVITAANLQWTTTVKNFSEQWKALKDKKPGDEPEVPKISRALPIIQWVEAFMDVMNRLLGVRMVPLAYVLRPVADVPAIGAQAAGTPHSIEHGSLETELTARASHLNALFREDNSTVYYKMEEATRGTIYAASIKPFSKRKDGRGARLAINGQYAGKDKWETEIKRHELHLHTGTFKGQNNYPLEKYVGSHRNAYVCMQQAALQVDIQLPNEKSRVNYMIDGILCNDAGLQAAMASIRTDQTVGGL